MKLLTIIILELISATQAISQNLNSSREIKIVPVFRNEKIEENKWFVSDSGDSLQLETLRFYLSQIQFEFGNGDIYTDSTAHLIDFSEPMSLKLSYPQKFSSIKSIKFNLGIDSLTNVAGALGGDLDPTLGMYWAWQSGYINLKLEGKSPSCKTRKNIFQFHIGGYTAPYFALRTIVLNAKNSKSLCLRVDISAFFKQINLSASNRIMIPCQEAMQLADFATQMFSLD